MKVNREQRGSFEVSLRAVEKCSMVGIACWLV